MFSVTDDDETFEFANLKELKHYLALTSTPEYAMDVIEWAVGTEPMLEMRNGKERDVWQRHN